MRLIFAFLIITSQGNSYNEKDIQIITSLLQPLIIKHCILIISVQDQVSIISLKIRLFSEKNVFAVYFDISELVKYLKTGKFPNARTAIILKIKDNSQLAPISAKLKFQISDPVGCSRFIWILIIPKKILSIQYDNYFQVPFNCEFLFIRNDGVNYEITEIYRVNSQSNSTQFNFGYYTDNYNLEINERRPLRDNLQGKEMIVEEPDKIGFCTFVLTCLHYELWNDFGRALNYSTKAVPTKDLSKYKPDALNLAQPLYYLVKSTNRIVGPLLTSKAHMYIRSVHGDHNLWTAYFDPFDKGVWLAIFYWISIAGSATAAIAYFISRILSLQGFTLFDQGLTPMTALCNQGIMQRPQLGSIRIARICAFVVSGIIFPAYSASITSFLTTDSNKLPFTDLETFAADKTYKMATIMSWFFVSFFRDTNDKTVQEIREKYLINYTEFPANHQACVDILCKKDKFAIVNINYRMLETWSPCKITLIPNDLISINTGFELINDGLQYKKLFTEMSMKFRSAGVLYKTQKGLYARIDFTEDKIFKPIGVNVVAPLLVVLSVGIISSVLFFAMEIMIYNSKPRRSIPKANSWSKRTNSFSQKKEDECRKIPSCGYMYSQRIIWRWELQVKRTPY